jgi:hypothetical protein
MSMSWLGPIRQISYTTDNLDQLLQFWETEVGLGPWTVFRNLTLTMNYEGRPISVPVHVALGLHGGVLIELMEIRGSGPSPFHDAQNRPIIGLQRLAAVSNDIMADAEAARTRGLEQFADGCADGQRYFYYRSAAAPGVILELLENTPSFIEFVAGLEARTPSHIDAKTAPVKAGARQQTLAGRTT